jgi:integrase
MATDVHHSKEDALSEREFEALLEGCQRLDDGYYTLEAKFIVLVAGRLGLRAGEITHMRESWIDWRRRMVVIPGFEECDKGREGGVCGYCRQHARQRANHNGDVTVAQALDESWTPKTSAAAREIPFDNLSRVDLIIERYFERFDRFTGSRTTVNRRLDAALEVSRGVSVDDTNPHGLRATAASFFADRQLDVIALQSMFGWTQLSTAQNYLRRSGESTARAIRDVQP